MAITPVTVTWGDKMGGEELVRLTSTVATLDSGSNYLCKNDWLGQPLLPEISGQIDRIGAKSLIFAVASLGLVSPGPATDGVTLFLVTTSGE